MMDFCVGLHPLPASPIKGEVSLHSLCSIQSQPPAGTSPLMGEARRGWGDKPGRDDGVWGLWVGNRGSRFRGNDTVMLENVQ